MSSDTPMTSLEGLSLPDHTVEVEDHLDYQYPEEMPIEFHDHEISVTQSQLDVITSPIDPNSTLQVIAGPGSGKTTTLVYKIAYMIGTLGIKPSDILVLSMTNRAVGALKSQVEDILGESVASCVDITTFHAFAHRLVLENTEGQGNTIQIIEDSGWRTLVELIDGNISKHILSKLLDKINTKGIDDHEVQKIIKFNKIDTKVLTGVLDTLKVSKIMVHSEVLRDAKALIDAGKIKKDYEVVIVDEFQDVYAELYHLIAVVGKKPHLITAGDPDQSIYSFLGSNAQVNNALQTLKPVNKIYLQETFRSTPEIIHASDTLLGKENPSITLKGIAGFKPMANLFTDGLEQCEWITLEIKRILNESEGIIVPNDITIMARTNSELAKMKKVLNVHGLMDTKLSSDPPWLSNNLYHLIDYLRVLVCPKESDFPIICTLGLLPRVGKVTIRKCHQEAIEKGISVWDYLIQENLAGSLKKQLVPYVIHLEDARRDVDFDDPESIFKTLLQLGHDLGLLSLVSKNLQTQVDKEQLKNQLQEFYENLKFAQHDKTPDTTVAQHFLKNYLNALPFSRGKKSVKLSTIHSAKGLEFPIVFLMGSSQPEFYLEDKKLTYVAMTRAKSLLYVNMLRTEPNSLAIFNKRFSEDVFSRTRPVIKGPFINGFAKEFNRTIPHTTTRSIHTLTRLIRRL